MVLRGVHVPHVDVLTRVNGARPQLDPPPALSLPGACTLSAPICMPHVQAVLGPEFPIRSAPRL